MSFLNQAKYIFAKLDWETELHADLLHCMVKSAYPAAFMEHDNKISVVFEHPAIVDSASVLDEIDKFAAYVNPRMFLGYLVSDRRIGVVGFRRIFQVKGIVLSEVDLVDFVEETLEDWKIWAAYMKELVEGRGTAQSEITDLLVRMNS